MEISRTEFEVLEALWQQWPCAASDVIKRLNQDKSWHEKTVKTLLGRLVKKGAINFSKEGRLYLYSPLIGRDEYQIKESRNLLEKLFGGRLSPLVSSFARSDNLTKADVEELKQVIAKWEKDNE
jgi:BlaI family penicillinase repressor